MRRICRSLMTRRKLICLGRKAITHHTRIRLRNPDFGSEGRRYGTPDVRVIETTAGRVIFNEIWPDELGYVNDKVDKSKLGDLILHCHRWPVMPLRFRSWMS